MRYDAGYFDGDQSPHHDYLYEDCIIKEARGVELDNDDKDDSLSVTTSRYGWYGDSNYGEDMNLTGRAIVGINVNDVDLYRSGDDENHFKFKIYACDQD